ncbi:Uncharacterised protein [Mycobacterium tuberculosis]|nr:Uncharacterised protein [Mycobacterium tuberculosis]
MRECVVVAELLRIVCQLPETTGPAKGSAPGPVAVRSYR